MGLREEVTPPGDESELRFELEPALTTNLSLRDELGRAISGAQISADVGGARTGLTTE